MARKSFFCRASKGTVLAVLLLVVPGCSWFGGQPNVPEGVATAYTVQTRLLVAYDHDADAYVRALIADPPTEDEQAEAIARWAALRENYEDAMLLHGAIASWLGLFDVLKELNDG